MARKNRPSVIIRRQDEDGHEPHHGGAWKIAYADFMTAMMAFFLVMWLLNATTDEQRRGIAQYFNPLADEKSAIPPEKIVDTPPAPMMGGSSFDRLEDNENMDTAGPVPVPYEGHGASSPIEAVPASHHQSEHESLPAQAAIVPIGGPEAGSRHDKPGPVGSEASRAEQANLHDMTRNLEQALKAGKDTSDHLDNVAISYGRDEIRIELHDTENVPMFELGASAPNKAARAMLGEIAKWLAPMPERISIVGYTDAAPFKGKVAGGMSNWTLSALRADQSREILVKSGYPDPKILDVSGGADRELADSAVPSAAANRRVVIIMHRLHPDINQVEAGSGTLTGEHEKPVDNSPGSPKIMPQAGHSASSPNP